MRAPAGLRGAVRSRDLAPAVAVAVALVLIAASTGSLSRYQLDVGFTLLTFLVLAQAWNILGGYGGQVSLAVSGFVGVGMYTTTLVLEKSGAGLAVALLAAGFVAAVGAAIFSFPLFRLRAAYFSVGTLALTLAAQAAVVNWSYAGATQGINVPFEDVPSQTDLFLMALALVAVTMAATWWVRRGSFGLRLMAVRDNEDAAGTLGVNAFRVKFVAFVLTSFLIGIAGGLLALRQVSIEPGASFGLSWTINAIVMAAVGGVGTILGPVVGVLIVYYGIQTQLESNPELSTILTGILLVLIVRFAPEGVWGLLGRTARRIFLRRGTPEPPAALDREVHA
jgi:branched-chain amino acid transport system permease protein